MSGVCGAVVPRVLDRYGTLEDIGFYRVGFWSGKAVRLGAQHLRDIREEDGSLDL